MNISFIPLATVDFKPLVDLLKRKTDDNFEIIQSFSNSLWIRGEEHELYFKSHAANRFVLSRIYIANARRGIGTQILHWMEEYANDHGFEELMIESSLTPEMNAFATKHSFIPLECSGYFIDSFFYGNWIRKCKNALV